MLTTGSGSASPKTPAVRSSTTQTATGRIALNCDYRTGDLLLLLLLTDSEPASTSGWVRRLCLPVNGRFLSVYSRRSAGAEGSSVTSPVAGEVNVLLLAVMDAPEWSESAATVDSHFEPVGSSGDGVVVGVAAGPSGLSITHRPVSFGLHIPPQPVSGDAPLLTILLNSH